MKTQIKELSHKLKDVHKRFLEQERLQAEKYFEKKIAPFEFLLMLTQDKSFEWMKPFSALIAEIDAFTDEAEEITKADLICIRDQVEYLISNEKSSVVKRYQHHLSTDADFIMFHANMKKVLSTLIGA